MNKILLFAGIFIVLFGGALFALGYLNVIAPKSIFNDSGNTSINDQGQININTAYEFRYQPLLNQIVVRFLISGVSASTDLEVSLAIDHQNPQNQDGTVLSQLVSFSPGDSRQIDFSIYVYDVIPSILTPAFSNPTDSFNLQILIDVIGPGTVSFNYEFQTEVIWKITVPLSYFVGIAGIVVLLIGIVVGRSGPKAGKPLKYQAAVYEPTLPSSGQQQSRFGGRSRGQKQQSSKKTKPSRGSVQASGSAARCKQCSKPVPRKAQYCPHCYARQ